ncbi:hypothetical protein CDEST_04066 [Colletotrichum destructivum]|uniref:Uncharacterized protein n=1 Tax=Colletotrichum destructivum TaxID=34406 RepID=A0AAX4I7C3_9PEZI|nr:hypothetical protein CDEST_04066 [Colletotrichum destructivum]
MEPDNFDARTLAELPTHLSLYRRDIYQRTCLSMISTGIHKWGFVVYRCTYGDDELWNRYLTRLKRFCHDDLVENRRAELLEQNLDWVVIEDRVMLDNASRSDMPRFRYCLYVDKQCLDTVIQFQEANDGTALFKSSLPPMVFAFIDRTWTPDGTDGTDDDDDDDCGEYEVEGVKEEKDGEEEDEEEDDDDEGEEDEEENEANDGGYPLIDGCVRKYVGWMYCNAIYVGGMYEHLLQQGLDDDESYQRPPAIFPRGKRSMPS